MAKLPLPTSATPVAAQSPQSLPSTGKSMEVATVQSRDSGFSPKPGAAQGDGAAEAIQDANRELERRTKDQMAMAIAVVLDQRDRALTAAAEAASGADEERAEMVAEHDKFVAFLMEEQDAKLEALQKQLADAKEATKRAQALGGSSAAPGAAPASPGDDAPPQLADVRRLLEEAYTELDQARAAAATSEEERDAALAAVDDVRVELYTQVEAARDEAIALQNQLDEVNQQLEESRDAARDEAIELSAQLDVAARELDERRSEVTRLRERLAALEEVKHSRPPPPAVSDELVKAREESQSLRKELIESKRALSRVTREYEILRSLRTRVAAKATGAEPASILERNVAAGRATLAGVPLASIERPQMTALASDIVPQRVEGVPLASVSGPPPSVEQTAVVPHTVQAVSVVPEQSGSHSSPQPPPLPTDPSLWPAQQTPVVSPEEAAADPTAGVAPKPQ